MITLALGVWTIRSRAAYLRPEELTGGYWGEIIDTELLNLRDTPSSDSERLKILDGGSKVYIEGVVEGEEVDGDTRWYRVRHQHFAGYVAAPYIRIMLPEMERLYTSEDMKFIQSLYDQQIPRAYFPGLLDLHRQFPLWRFTAAHFDFSLLDAVKDQYRISSPANLAPLIYPAMYKSLHPEHYDSKGDYFAEYEPGWVAASQNAVYDALNPLASLDAVRIFKFESLSYNPVIHTRQLIDKLLAGTFMSGSEAVSYLDHHGQIQYLDKNYAEIIEEATAAANLSPHHLISRITQELSVNGAPQAEGNLSGLEGYYNFLNVGAYGGDDPARSGVEFAKNGYKDAAQNEALSLPWDNPEKAIVGGAKFISRDYINAGQNTIYYEKFNLNGGLPLRHNYMTNVVAPDSEAANMYIGYRDHGLLYAPKEFIIPVFR